MTRSLTPREAHLRGTTSTAPKVAGAVGLLLLFGALAWLWGQRVSPPAIDQARVELRRKNLAELEALEQTAAQAYAWLDTNRGIVRLPAARGMELSLEINRDAAAGRSNLLLRLERATARLPEPVNIYE
jgi:hypothetical protein